jgi:DNA-binding XRE family transcriptional regulator
MSAVESTESEVSSIMDTWILLRDIELGGERNRGIYVLKSRGMAHSNQIREFLITSKGIDVVDVYTGPTGVLTGSARLNQEIKDQETEESHKNEILRLQRDLERQRKLTEAQVTAIQAEFTAKEDELNQLINQEKRRVPDHRGKHLSTYLLMKMEEEMLEDSMKIAYTIARSLSYPVNSLFSRAGYAFGGTLVKNTNICGSFESMNVWYKTLE